MVSAAGVNEEQYIEELLPHTNAPLKPIVVPPIVTLPSHVDDPISVNVEFDVAPNDDVGSQVPKHVDGMVVGAAVVVDTVVVATVVGKEVVLTVVTDGVVATVVTVGVVATVVTDDVVVGVVTLDVVVAVVVVVVVATDVVVQTGTVALHARAKVPPAPLGRKQAGTEHTHMFACTQLLLEASQDVALLSVYSHCWLAGLHWPVVRHGDSEQSGQNTVSSQFGIGV